MLPAMPLFDGAHILWRNGSVSSPTTTIGQVVYSAGGECGPRTQANWQLVVIHSGDCTLARNGKAERLAPKTIYLMRPGQREHFRFSTTGETHHSWCEVKPDRLPKYLGSQLSKMPDSVSCSETFLHLLQAAFGLQSALADNTKAVIDSIGVALLCEFINIHSKAVLSHEIDPCVFKAVHYMDGHYMEESCLTLAHRHAGVPRNTLINKFRSSLGTTPGNYLWKVRTENGISLLFHTGLSVSEIAFRCGFKTPFHFSRKVTQLRGCPPSQLRNHVP